MNKNFYISNKEIGLVAIGMLLVLLVGVGALSNMFVITNNNCQMPYLSESDFGYSTHFAFSEFSEVNYPIFSDIISIGPLIFSIGDLIMFFSLIGLIIFVTKIVYGNIKYKREILIKRGLR